MLVRVHYATKRQMYSRGNCQKTFKNLFIKNQSTERKRCRMFHDKFKKKAGKNTRPFRFAPKIGALWVYDFALRFFFSIDRILSVFANSPLAKERYLVEPSRQDVTYTITFFALSSTKP